MACNESRAMRLKRKYSLPDLESMLKEVQGDPENQANGWNGLCKLTKRAEKLCDDITWAMYHIRTNGKGNAVMASSPAEPRRNW